MTLIDDAYATLSGHLPGSQVSNPGGPAVAMDPNEENRLRDQQYAQWQAQQAVTHDQQQQRLQGFMGNLGWRPQSQMFGANPAPMVPPPPAGWAYTPGKGAGWQTPQHTIQDGPDKQSQNWSYSPAASGSPFTGNRI